MLRTIGRVACIGVTAALVGGALFFFVERAPGTTAGLNGLEFRGRHANRWEEAAGRPAARGGERVEQVSPWRGRKTTPAARRRGRAAASDGTTASSRPFEGLAAWV